MKKDGIILSTHIGTWYVVDEANYYGEKYQLLEHEEYGDEAAGVVINDKMEIIIEECFNGFLDLEEYFDSIGWVDFKGVIEE